MPSAHSRLQRRLTDPTDLRLLAALLGLLFLSVPVISGVSGSLGDAVGAAAGLYSLLPIATRSHRAPRLRIAIAALVLAYLFSSVGAPQHGYQGLRHTASTAAAGSAILLFATYGKEMVAYRWFRGWAYALVTIGVLAVNFGHMSKNATGGAVAYLVAFMMSLLIYSKPQKSWFYAGTFFLVTGTLAFLLDFRGLVAYTAVLILGYWGAKVLSRKTFWLIGVVGCITWVSALTWYFLHTFTSPRAFTVSQWIALHTGRPATSGRQVLWPAITRAVAGHEWTGLGAGALPRDILNTELSSHSTYMQTYLQLGYIGVILIAVVLLTLWSRLALHGCNESSRFGAAVLLMYVVHNSTEVLMFENRLMAAIPAWCAIGLAISLVGSAEEADREITPANGSGDGVAAWDESEGRAMSVRPIDLAGNSAASGGGR
ncbi:O-antigen ligase family protein [Nocardioides sp. DS6]|uniref:O-antigen ligase family protein n=1 Tax=Nocardioides eburneus TaxID=3231482 RepID=A0ABV3SWP7_9ACTN